MFKVDDTNAATELKQHATQLERAYTIKPDDYLSLQVFSNGGERVIDPDAELIKNIGNVNEQMARPQLTYLVQPDGTARFPMIGSVKVENLSLQEAEILLQSKYDQFYKDCFVALTFQNKRFVVLGASGGQVIPLPNQNVTLAEALALAKGVTNEGKAQNIRIIRNDKVFVIDMSTIDGYLQGNMVVLPDDIVYIEPVRRPLAEAFRDYSIVGGLLISLASLIIVITTQN